MIQLGRTGRQPAQQARPARGAPSLAAQQQQRAPQSVRSTLACWRRAAVQPEDALAMTADASIWRTGGGTLPHRPPASPAGTPRARSAFSCCQAGAANVHAGCRRALPGVAVNPHLAAPATASCHFARLRSAEEPCHHERGRHRDLLRPLAPELCWCIHTLSRSTPRTRSSTQSEQHRPSAAPPILSTALVSTAHPELLAQEQHGERGRTGRGAWVRCAEMHRAN